MSAPVNFAWWIRGKEFAELARISMQSVRKVYGTDAILWAVTDDADPDWHIPECRSTIYCRPRYPQAMVANVDCQHELLTHLHTGSKVFFLDADTIVRSRLPDQPADLIVTWRDHVNGEKEMAREQPYNYGVLGMTVSPKTLEIMVWMRYRILQMAPQYQEWYGNQLALADLLGQPRGSRFTAKMRWTLNDPGSDIDVLSLPCERWNYTPEYTNEDVGDKAVLHFKGSRKHFMEIYSRDAA